MLRPRSLASGLIGCVVLAVRVAHADPSSAEISAARHAFESAVSLERDQHWAEAELKLREAIAVKDTPGLRFHLAHCETEQGHLVEAARDYERANELLRHGAKAPDVQKLLGPASEALDKRIPRVAVDLPSDVPSPSAILDGKVYPPSELALGLAFDPGRHELRVSAAGRAPFARTFELREGERITIRPELPPSAPARPVAAPAPVAVSITQVSPPADDTPPRSQGSSTKLYLMLGESALTVAGLAVGIGYELRASAANERVDQARARIDGAVPGDATACGSGNPALVGVCRDLRAAHDDHDRARLLATIGYVSAGVGATALLTTWIFYPSANAPAAAGLRVRPVVGLGQVGLVGQF